MTISHDDGNEVDSADIVDGSLSGADVSSSSGDVTHTGGNMGLGVDASSFAQLYVLQNTASSMAIRATSAPPNGTGRALVAIAGGNGSKAVDAWANSPTGTTYGMHSVNDSVDGTAVYGNAAAATGNTVGVHGTVASTAGIAVQGHATSTSGLTTGVLGLVDSANGSAVAGDATAGNGFTVGVSGTVASEDGIGIVASNTSDGQDPVALYATTAGMVYPTAVVGEAAASPGAVSTVVSPIGVRGSSTGLDLSVGVLGAASTPGLETTDYNTGHGVGVLGLTQDPSFTGVVGLNRAGTGNGYGVFGEVFSWQGTGVYGKAPSGGATGGTGVHGAGKVGVRGVSQNHIGVLGAGASVGVYGQSPDTALGTYYSGAGVNGYSTTAGGAGVAGVHVVQTGVAHGVYGECNSSDGETAGVYGINNATSSFPRGVLGVSLAATGRAVFGDAKSSTGSNIGVTGRTFSPSGFGVYSSGDFGGTGAKYFVQPHPTDASKEIRFVCLEGNESGTYFRGSTQLVGGRVVVDVPEAFRLVSEPEGLTVQLTTVGAANVWLASYDLDQVVIEGTADVEVHYTVNGIRLGFAGHDPIADNVGYIPEVRGQPFGSQYRPEHRRLLVQNGILNPDFTPNEATAQRLGWQLAEASPGRTELRRYDASLSDDHPLRLAEAGHHRRTGDVSPAAEEQLPSTQETSRRP